MDATEDDDLEAFGRKIGKAASYLHGLMVQGHVRLVTMDLFNLGIFGQLVAVELAKRLTKEETVVFEKEMQIKARTNAPRIRQNRVLDNLSKLHDKAVCAKKGAVVS